METGTQRTTSVQNEVSGTDLPPDEQVRSQSQGDKGGPMLANSPTAPKPSPASVDKSTVQTVSLADTAEGRRLLETQGRPLLWRRWGPYVSERAWGTVREDYSSNGAAWDSLSHDMARSKAYRWGEDGLAAICDRYQLLVFS